MAAWVGAGGALLGGLSSIVGTATRNNNQQQQKLDYSLANLDAAQNNEQYQRALSALINQRSIAGTQDTFGSSLRYDPATNTWVSALGPLPEAAQRASDLASIARNTTDVRQAQAANQTAALRAAQAGPTADTAIRDLQSFKPMSSDELAGLLQQTSTTAANATYRPLVADTLRSFQRSGTAAGPVLADIGRQQYTQLRDSLAKNRIDALTGTDAINQSRRQGLEQSAANRYTLATPQFQYPGINTATGSNTMANLVAQRAQQAGTAPAFGASGVNTAAGQRQTAGAGVAGAVPGQLNTAADIGKDIGSMLSNKQFTENVQDIFDPATGIGSTSNWEKELMNSPLSQYYRPPASDTVRSATDWGSE